MEAIKQFATQTSLLQTSTDWNAFSSWRPLWIKTNLANRIKAADRLESLSRFYSPARDVRLSCVVNIWDVCQTFTGVYLCVCHGLVDFTLTRMGGSSKVSNISLPPEGILSSDGLWKRGVAGLRKVGGCGSAGSTAAGWLEGCRFDSWCEQSTQWSALEQDIMHQIAFWGCPLILRRWWQRFPLGSIQLLKKGIYSAKFWT